MYDKNSKFPEQILIAIDVNIDDIAQAFQIYSQKHWIEEQNPQLRKPRRIPQLSASEIITILIFYHYSGYKCFEHYYRRLLLQDLLSYFPSAPSYDRFLELIERTLSPLQILSKILCSFSQKTGIYYIDSKKLPVCHPKRIAQNKVFEGIAGRGKSSTGWFYGLKLHLLINEKGQIMSFQISPGNRADNNKKLLSEMLKGFKGLCFGDKGYLTKIWEELYENGLKLVHKVRKNMQNKLIQIQERYLLAKRALIESVNNILASVFNIEHTRHRKIENAFVHILAGISAYHFYPDKPSFNIPYALKDGII